MFLIIFSVGQSAPAKANSYSFDQKIPRFLWKPQINYAIHKSPSLVPVMDRMSTIHPEILFLNVHCSIVFPSVFRSLKLSGFLKFSSLSAMYLTSQRTAVILVSAAVISNHFLN